MSGAPPPHRSWLYAPGHRPDLVQKALAGRADAVVVDLEDAVPGQRKDEARTCVAALLATPTPKPVFVRVNDVRGPWCRADIDAVTTPHLAGLRVPKCETVQDVHTVTGWLDAVGSSVGLYLLLESARGVEEAYALATSTPRVLGIGLGEADLRASLRTSADGGLDYARSRVVTAARAAGLPSPVQSVHIQLRDPDGLRRSTERGRALGFFGRSVVHPEQVDIVNEVYTPTADEVRDARRLLTGLTGSAAAGVTAYVDDDGRFIDPAVVESARWTVAVARPETATGDLQDATRTEEGAP